MEATVDLLIATWDQVVQKSEERLVEKKKLGVVENQVLMPGNNT
jgi:hypothetical protein